MKTILIALLALTSCCGGIESGTDIIYIYDSGQQPQVDAGEDAGPPDAGPIDGGVAFDPFAPRSDIGSWTCQSLPGSPYTVCALDYDLLCQGIQGELCSSVKDAGWNVGHKVVTPPLSVGSPTECWGPTLFFTGFTCDPSDPALQGDCERAVVSATDGKPDSCTGRTIA